MNVQNGQIDAVAPPPLPGVVTPPPAAAVTVSRPRVHDDDKPGPIPAARADDDLDIVDPGANSPLVPAEKPAEQPAKAETPPAQPAAPPIDPRLYQRAAAAGLGPDEIAGVSPAALAKLLARVEAAQPAPPAPAKPEEKAEEKPARKPFDRKALEEQGYLPEVIDAFEKAHKVDVLEEQVGLLLGREQRRAMDAARRQIDQAFNDLGHEWVGVFGEGEGQRLDPEGAELRQRNEVLREMDVLAFARHQRQLPPLNHGELMRRAIASLGLQPAAAPTNPAAPAREAFDRPRNDRGQFTTTARPSPRETPPPAKGDALALQGISAAIGATGPQGEFSEADDREGLL
jgi:hypothetical protein